MVYSRASMGPGKGLIRPLYIDRLKGVFGSSLIAYWTLGESAGLTATDASSNGHDGAYSNVTLGAAGIGDGRAAASFNGTSSYVNVYSTSLRNAFNPLAGTLLAWFKMANSGVWTDGVGRRVVTLQADSSNLIIISRPTTNNLLILRYTAGGVIISRNVTINTADWVYTVITWNKSLDQVGFYLYGVRQGSLQSGLGNWAGSLASALIGAGTTTPTLIMAGSIAHVALGNRALNTAEIQGLNVLP